MRAIEVSTLVIDLDTMQALVGKLPAPRDLKVIDQAESGRWTGGIARAGDRVRARRDAQGLEHDYKKNLY